MRTTVYSTVGRLIRITRGIAAVALTCALSACSAAPGGASTVDGGAKKASDSGMTVAAAETRSLPALIYPVEHAHLGRVLGVAPDGRIWYARVEDEAAGLEWDPTWSIECVSPKGVARGIASFPKDIRFLGGELSPDARHLAYALRTESDGNTGSDSGSVSLFLMGSDGSENRKVATFSGWVGEAPNWVYRVSWAPDSTRVAVPVRSAGRNRIALVSVPAGELEYLPTPEWADVTCPDWSPDGNSVAYSCEDRRWKPEQVEGTDWTSFRWHLWLDSGQTEAGAAAEAREERKHIRPAAIWVADLRSGKSRRMTKTPNADTVDLLPRWSPGGTQIAYARWKWDHEFCCAHYWWLDLRNVQADGTKDRMIEDLLQRSEWGAVSASAAAGEMRWLPDGRRIVFRGCQKGAEGRATGLAMVRVDGTQAWPLTPGMSGWPRVPYNSVAGSVYTTGLSVQSFALSPDGRYAVASGDLWGDRRGIWEVPVAGVDAP